MNKSTILNLTINGWISVKDHKPPLIDEYESELVLCVGWKSTNPYETIQYELMTWEKLNKPKIRNYKGDLIKYGWSNRWWDENPDLYEIHFWKPLKNFGIEQLIIFEEY